MSATTITTPDQIGARCRRPVTGFILTPISGDRSQRIVRPLQATTEVSPELQPGKVVSIDGSDYIVKLRVGNPQ